MLPIHRKIITDNLTQSMPVLIPLYVCTAVGMAGAVYYTLRLATRNPDVSWNRNELSNETYRTKQYKFYSPIRDYTNIDSPAPKY